MDSRSLFILSLMLLLLWTPLAAAHTIGMMAKSANGKIAFTSTRDSPSGEVYMMNSDGSDQTRLTNTHAHTLFSAWSPDGSKLAFVSNTTGHHSDIYVMNADGSGQIALTHNSGDSFRPVWSPDGSKIAFTANRDGNLEIYVMNADGSGQRRLTNNPALDAEQTWSPDGRKIAFTSDRDDPKGEDIYVMNVDGSEATRLTSNSDYDNQPTWSPDGKQILFYSNRGDTESLWLMNADGSNQHRLTDNPWTDFWPSWSPDGKKIAFVGIEDPNCKIYVINPDGSGQIRLTDAPGRNNGAAWSPDGSKIAFMSNRDGNWEIYVMNADGSGQRRLTTNPADDYSPVWQPVALAVPPAQGTAKVLWSVTSNPTSGSQANGIAIDGSSVYIVGYDSAPGFNNYEWRIEKRSLADGSLIWTTASDPSTANDAATGVAVDGSGVYIVGDDSSPGPSVSEWRIEKRSLADGSLIWMATGNPSGYLDVAWAVAVDGSGVYVAGWEIFDGWRVEKRSLTDGSLIWAKASETTKVYGRAYGIAVDTSGVYVAGYESVRKGMDRWRIEKRSLTDGSLTWAQTGNPGDSSGARGIAVDASGVYIAGSENATGSPEWRIEKRGTSSGELIWTVATNKETECCSAARGVAVDGFGVYVTGHEHYSGGSPDDERWVIEKRSLTDGSIIWTATSNPTASFDMAFGIGVDHSGVYVCGFEWVVGTGFDTEWRIEKRSTDATSSTVAVSFTFRVYDADSGSAIPGASVLFDGSLVGVTDSNGWISITTTYPPADHSYRVSASGYEDESSTATIGSNSGGWFEINLKRSTPKQTIQQTVSTTIRETAPTAASTDLGFLLPIGAVGLVVVLGVILLARRKQAKPRPSVVPENKVQETEPGRLFEVSVSVPSVGKTVTLEVATNHTVGSVAEALASTLNLPKNKTYAIEYAGKLISRPDFGKTIGDLGIKGGSKLTLRVVQ